MWMMYGAIRAWSPAVARLFRVHVEPCVADWYRAVLGQVLNEGLPAGPKHA